jgi:hypothetical protein
LTYCLLLTSVIVLAKLEKKRKLNETAAEYVAYGFETIEGIDTDWARLALKWKQQENNNKVRTIKRATTKFKKSQQKVAEVKAFINEVDTRISLLHDQVVAIGILFHFIHIFVTQLIF